MPLKAVLAPWFKTRWKLCLLLTLLPFLVILPLCLRYLLDPRAPGSLTYTLREHGRRIPFDSRIWKKFPRSTNEWPHTDLLPVRLRMIDDLMKRHNLRGSTRQEIESLLGQRTETPYFSEWDLVYYLGPGRYGDAVGDSEWLVLRFDTNRFVKEYRVVHD
jgi:hypothetical protein